MRKIKKKKEKKHERTYWNLKNAKQKKDENNKRKTKQKWIYIGMAKVKRGLLNVKKINK